MRLHHALCAVLTVVFGAASLHAQSASFPSRRLGIVAGINSATISGGDVGEPSRRTGFIVGALLFAPVSHSVAIEPQVLFTSKGASFEDASGGGSISMSYIQLPVLLRITGPANGEWRPFGFVGPAIALKASCNLEGIDSGVRTSVRCAELEADGVKFKSFDYGLVVGGGFAFDVQGRTFSIGARYDHSLADIDEVSGIKHRVISVIASFEFPWMK